MPGSLEVKDRQSLLEWASMQPPSVVLLAAHRLAARVLSLAEPGAWQEREHWARYDDMRPRSALFGIRTNLYLQLLAHGKGDFRAARLEEYLTTAERMWLSLDDIFDTILANAHEASIWGVSAGLVAEGARSSMARQESVELFRPDILPRALSEVLTSVLRVNGKLVGSETAAEPGFWREVRADLAAAASEGRRALDLSPDLQRLWEKTKAKWAGRGAAWDYWIKWYEDILAGREPDWQRLERVRMISGDVWDQGAEAVAAEIARIELEFAVEASPNAEDIIINDAGLYEAIPRSTLPARTLQDARDRMTDTIRLIRGAEMRNQHVALLPEADLLEDALDRYGDNALRLHEVCFKVARHVGTHVANGVLPEADNLVGDVTGDLQNTADDIYNFDNEVRRTVDARAKLRFGRLGETAKKQVEQLALAVAERSVPALADELREDAAAVLAEGAPNLDTSINRYRLGSRLARVVALGGQPLRNVAGALVWVGGVGGGVVVLSKIIFFLLGVLL